MAMLPKAGLPRLVSLQTYLPAAETARRKEGSVLRQGVAGRPRCSTATVNSDDFRGVPDRCLQRERNDPSVSQPAQSTRPVGATRATGFRTPAALGNGHGQKNRLGLRQHALRWNAAAAGFAREKRGMGCPHPSFCRRSTRASRAPQEKATSRPLEGPKAPGVMYIRTCATRTPL